MRKKISNTLHRVIDPVISRLNEADPGRLRLYLNLFLLAEIIYFVGSGIYRHNPGQVFSDAFAATTVGGLYSFAAPILMNLKEPLYALENLGLTWESFGVWCLSGFGYIALLKYNELTDNLDYGRPLQFIHSVFFCLFCGAVAAPIAFLVLGALLVPADCLWKAGPLLLKAIAVVPGLAAIAFLVICVFYAVKALIDVLKDFIKLYLFIFIILLVLLGLTLLLGILVSFMEQSSLLSSIISGIDSLLISAGVDENSAANFITKPAFIKGAIGFAVFLMYNISALLHDDGIVL